MIKYDPISLLIYIIIIIIVYVVIGLILKIFEYYLMLPFFVYFNRYVIQHPLLIIPRIIYSIIYSTYAIIFISVTLAIIIIILIVLYIIRFILLEIIVKIPFVGFIGPIMYNVIPPFIQLDNAGIFKLIDNIIEALFKNIPFLEKFYINISKILILFSKDKIIDLIQEINPNMELDKSQFNKVFIERFMNNDNNKKDFNEILKDSKIKIKDYIEKFEESNNKNSLFYNKTKNAIDKALAAETYKSYDSSLPNMTLIEIMKTALNNNTIVFTKRASIIGDNLKLETSKTAD